MTASLLDGAAAASHILRATAERAAAFAAAGGRRPCLATVLIGNDPASDTYVRMKARRAGQHGIDSQQHRLPTTATTAHAIDLVTGLSNDPDVDGILVQHPAPSHIDERAVFEAIAPDKDVDGVTSHSFAHAALASPRFSSCTPGGIIRLLDAYGLDPAGRHAVIVGRSAILGKPAAMLLLARNATVTIAHTHTGNLPQVVADADLLIAAAGRAELIDGAWIKPGAIVIDAGYHPGNLGDVDFAGARSRAAWITPVPGGVGPMTIATLLDQTVDAAYALTGTAT